MQEISMNIWALLACVVVRLAVGALWYSPVAFLPAWMKLAGVKEKQMKQGMAKAIVTDLVTSLVMAFVLVHAVKYAGAHDAGHGAAVGFLNWLGLVMPVQAGMLTYEHKPMKYFLIVSGYQLVTLVIMGAILGQWG